MSASRGWCRKALLSLFFSRNLGLRRLHCSFTWEGDNTRLVSAAPGIGLEAMCDAQPMTASPTPPGHAPPQGPARSVLSPVKPW